MLRDEFSIDIVLRHPSRSAQSIARALSVEPKIAFSVSAPRRRVFRAVLEKGDSSAKFQLALPKIVKFLARHDEFWKDFSATNGSGELIFNFALLRQAEKGDKCFELYLTPIFCQYLSASGIGLKIQGWQGCFHPRRLGGRTKA